jgi:phosphatidylserine/phosphatidylglycerophosphate/cardiolipin synthase-like enzyme
MNKLDPLVPIINAHVAELKQPGVAFIRPGYKLENDWPTTEPAIVVVLSQNAPAPALPAEVDGIKVDVRRATAVEQMRHDEPVRFAKIAATRPEVKAGALPEIDPVAEDAEALAPPPTLLAAKPQISYTPANVPLAPVTGKMTITCHASPDAGWPTLRTFLTGTQKNLTIGLYDFTSAHILEGLELALTAPTKKLTITLDNPALNPTADQSDSDTLKALETELDNRFHSAWALVRSNKAVQRWIFPTAYHIKVAVRDGSSLWLSSGNWNNSNQPDMDPIGNPQAGDQQLAKKSDRDWHVIIDHAGLARTYEAYLKHDFEVASGIAGGGPAPLAAEPGVFLPADFLLAAHGQWQFFAPLRLENQQMTITPLLTPDPGVYTAAMLRLLRSATVKLYIQLQYIHPSDVAEDAKFNALIDVVSQKIAAGVDVRIIVSQFQKSNGWLERLQAAGVDLSVVKLQNGVHNKGFVIDSKVVALGSQNWSGDGALRNRDASVIIENSAAAKYYEKIFLHDWTNIAKQSVS